MLNTPFGISTQSPAASEDENACIAVLQEQTRRVVLSCIVSSGPAADAEDYPSKLIDHQFPFDSEAHARSPGAPYRPNAAF